MVDSLSWQAANPAKSVLNSGAALSLSQPAASVASAQEPKAAPLFGTDGIRGRVGELLTAPLALQVGFWTGQVLRNVVRNTSTTPGVGPVIIGQDSRLSGDMLATALTAGLTAAGLEVWSVGLCPTPAVAYLCQTLGAAGGIMVSASHNPPEDNGIKVFGPDGTKLTNALQQEIERGVRGELPGPCLDNSTGWGRFQHRPDTLQSYGTALVSGLLSSLPATELAGLRVVLDLAWGAASQIGPQLFRELGAEVIVLNGVPRGECINVNCGSTHLQPLQQAVLAHQADLGFAFDGDADRVLAVDSQGRAVNGDYILYLWGRQLQQQQRLPGNTLVATVMANLAFERAWQRLGGEFVRTPVGDQHVHAEMVRRGAALGGEQSGHVLCFHYGVSGDGLLTALHLAALIQQSGLSLSEWVDASFQPYPQLLCNVRVEDRQRRLAWKDNPRIQAAIAEADANLGDQGRVLVRASGTEPLIRVMVEAATELLTRRWTERLCEVVSAELA